MSSVIVTRQNDLPEVMNVIVTGASSGIGLAQVQEFLSAGHQVLAIDKQPLPRKIALSKNLLFLQADVSQAEAVKHIFEWIDSIWGTVHILCNTAGVLDDFKKIEETSMSHWEEIMKINVTSMFLMTQSALPYLLKVEASRIINMASIASLTAGGGGIAYTTAKHAIAGFTKQMAFDYAQTGLRVNAIAPGAIQTKMTEADFNGEQPMAQWVAEQTPVRRWAQPEEVAKLTLYLASDASDYMNGVILPLDGGWLIR